MLVELIGPAGCGKTTVARELDARLAALGVDRVGMDELAAIDRRIGEKRITRYNFPGKTWMLLPLALRHPTVVAGVFALALLHGPPRKRRIRQANRALAHFRMLKRLRRRTRGRVLVVHEGLLQMLWSTTVESEALRGRWIVRHVLRRYQRVLAPHGILFRIDDATAQERVFQRTHGNRFSASSSAERRRDFPRWLAYHRELVALAPPGLVRDVVDASEPLDALVRRVGEAILARVAAGPQGARGAPRLAGAPGEGWQAERRSL
jgi:hypothetical protein